MAPIKLLTVTLLSALLAACATTPTGPLPATPVAPYRDNIGLSGRLAANYEKDGKGESVSSVKFIWKQSAAGTDITLYSPLGQTVASISVMPTQATLTESGKPPRSAADIDTLSAQALGWALPVSGLREWLQGYAAAADGSRFIASQKNDSVTTRDGWRLHYVSWQDGKPDAPPQPKRIDAERSATASAAEVAIRIVIDEPDKP
ncbi:MAG TPA: outer membrane lipoprotein LolB [Janthinobacterium sp.]|nr:outer membrane lipoprotein LolB [Janthinobacterium sp.]